MQKQSKPDSLKDQDPKRKISKIYFASWIRGFRRHSSHPFFWRIRIRKLNLDLVPRSCKYAVNQLVWRIRIPKLNLDLVPKSCKNTQNQVVWRIRIRKVRFPKLILHCGLEAFVDICVHLSHPFFWRIRIRKLNLDLVPNSCKCAVNQVAWRIRIPKLNLDLVPKSCKNTQNQVVWRIRIRKVRFPKLILHCGLEAFVDIRLILFLKDQGPKTEPEFSPKIMQIRCKPAGLEDPNPRIESRYLVPRSCK